MADDIGGAGDSMRAVATLLIIVLVLAVLYFGGVLGSVKTEKESNIKMLSLPNSR